MPIKGVHVWPGGLRPGNCPGCGKFLGKAHVCKTTGFKTIKNIIRLMANYGPGNLE